MSSAFPRTYRLMSRRFGWALLLGMSAALAWTPAATAGPKGRVDREKALVELGRRLFFDPAASRSGANACASCHDPDHGFSDPDRLSLDDLGLTRRHSQTLIDSHLNPSAHWDGEFRNIEELTVARLRPFRGVRSRGVGAHGQAVTSTPTAEGATMEQSDVPTRPVVEEDIEIGNDDDDGSYDGEGRSGSPSSRGAGDDASGSGASGEGSPSTPPDGGSDNGCDVCGTDDAIGAPNQDADRGAAPTPVEAEAAEAEAANAEAPAAEARPEDDRWSDNSDGEPRLTRDEAIRERFDPSRLPRVADVIARGGRYDDLFRAAFGSTRVTTQKLARAIEAYCLSIESTEAPIDRYLAGADDALSASAKRGMELFRGSAGCAECHTMKGARPTFTDFKFHNTGVTLHDMVARDGQAAVRHRLKPDEGRAERSKRPGDVRTFKTPTLRDLTRRGPYMHSGRFETLESVVRYYVRGGGPDPQRDSRVRRGLKLTDAEVGDLVAFLESLTGDARPGLAAEPLPLRADVSRVRILDARGRALAGLRVRLVPEGDVLPAEQRGLPGERMATTDAKGWIRFVPSDRTHVRIVLPDGLPITDGALIPDTCRKTSLRVPVKGRVALLVSAPKGAVAPDTLVAEHLWGNAIPGHTAPRTRLQATRRLEVGSAQLVRYEGWMRTDVPARVALRLPGDRAGLNAPELVLRAGEELRVSLTR